MRKHPQTAIRGVVVYFSKTERDSQKQKSKNSVKTINSKEAGAKIHNPTSNKIKKTSGFIRLETTKLGKRMRTKLLFLERIQSQNKEKIIQIPEGCSSETK